MDVDLDTLVDVNPSWHITLVKMLMFAQIVGARANTMSFMDYENEIEVRYFWWWVYYVYCIGVHDA